MKMKKSKHILTNRKKNKKIIENRKKKWKWKIEKIKIHIKKRYKSHSRILKKTNKNNNDSIYEKNFKTKLIFILNYITKYITCTPYNLNMNTF